MLVLRVCRRDAESRPGLLCRPRSTVVDRFSADERRHFGQANSLKIVMIEDGLASTFAYGLMVPNIGKRADDTVGQLVNGEKRDQQAVSTVGDDLAHGEAVSDPITRQPALMASSSDH